MAKKNQNAPVQESITSTGETEKDLQGENIQNPVEENVQENTKVNEQVNEQVEPKTVELKNLKVNIAFTDKYDDKISYKVNDIIKADSISDERYDELLKDERKIVSIVE